MKKCTAILMSAVLLLGLMAGCGRAEETQPTVAGPASALEVLQNIWGGFADEEKFSIYGGNPKENFEDNTMDAPDVYDLTDENISYNLLIPADQIANVDDAASMTHSMMANNFNAAVYHVTGDMNAFADAMYQAVSGNMWICGMPERVIVADMGSGYVLVAYGVGDALNPFETHMLEAYPEADLKYNEPIV